MEVKEVHSILLNFEKRAENKPEAIISATFVDAEPLINVISAPLNQIIFGRRGTGKTHALKYCLARTKESGDAAVYLDIRSIGSNGSIYSDDSVPEVERGLKLATDILMALHDELLQIALHQISTSKNPEQITRRLDDFAGAITEVRISGQVSLVEEKVSETKREGSWSASGNLREKGAELNAGASAAKAQSTLDRTTSASEGKEQRSIDFGRTQVSLDGLIKILGLKRFWLFLDEWSEAPREVQPYLADLIRKTLLPNSQVVVKIAAIEQRSSFLISKAKGGYIGLEFGADIGADLNLDEFLVFDYDEDRAISFFRELLFRNYIALGGETSEFSSSKAFVNFLFTEKRAFEEFVRAVEGVPRDALNLISKAVMKAFGQKIGIDTVRKAALDWYQADKVNVVNSSGDLQNALNHIIDEVIGNRRARAFLFSSGSRHVVIDRLYDARILHLLRKNISSRDEPGKRYDAWKIDYGCYVDLVRTQHAPLGLLPDEEGFVEVPGDDYRSIRRAVLDSEDLDRFLQS